MKRSFPHLCSPITLGKVTFRNRIFAAPMGSTDITADCGVGPRTPGFYELRAKGGAAAVTASELVVHPATDGSHMLHLDLQTPGLLAGFTYLADGIKRHGAVPSVELSHSGQYAGTYLVDKDKKSRPLSVRTKRRHPPRRHSCESFDKRTDRRHRPGLRRKSHPRQARRF